MTFPPIQDSSGPGEFSWKVHLDEGQALELLNDQHAQVYFIAGHIPAGTISPVSAHDAHGATVPTSLGISGSNVITLFVHHQAGNSAAGGAPFVYPIIAGAGWEGGFVTHHVQMPPSEAQLAEAGSQLAEAGCLVPKLKGRTLKGAKRRLGKSDCRVGKVRKLRGASARTGRVTKQNPRPGRLLGSGATVDVTLAQESP